MTTFNSAGGNGESHPGIGQRVDQIGSDAQQLIDDARGAVSDLGQRLDLRGRVERNPYGTLLAAAGIGYILGGGLFTPLTGRIVKLGLRLAALPIVKDELLGFAEAAVNNLHRSNEAGASSNGPGPGSSTPVA